MLGNIPKDDAERKRQAEEVLRNFSPAQAAKSGGTLCIIIATIIAAFNLHDAGWVSTTFIVIFAACGASLWSFSARRMLIESQERKAAQADKGN